MPAAVRSPAWCRFKTGTVCVCVSTFLAAVVVARQAEKRRRQLVDVVKQVTLRRTKAIIADQLPRKTDNVVFCQLQPLQYRWELLLALSCSE